MERPVRKTFNCTDRQSIGVTRTLRTDLLAYIFLVCVLLEERASAVQIPFAALWVTDMAPGTLIQGTRG